MTGWPGFRLIDAHLFESFSEFGSAGDLQLGVDILYMLPHRMYTEMQGFRHFSGRSAGRELFQNLLFPYG